MDDLLLFVSDLPIDSPNAVRWQHFIGHVRFFIHIIIYICIYTVYIYIYI